ncbi:hypothetical protein [uncultured Flavobacterium sp.]|uniref:hypothetical protein n=1 Tax=uncultured Flavobacterium sp. TaxID=165435 RepID=UPI0030EC322C
MIKVGYLISYDYKMIFTSMALLYKYADEIHLAIDKKRLTWSGNSFELPDSFFEEIERFDTENKIKLYFDDFYKQNLTPIECDTRERTMLAKKMGKGWLLQIDVDEYIYDFEQLAKYLRKKWYLLLFPKWTPVVFRANWITLYKQLNDGFLFIKNNETFPLLTNIPSYEYCRENTKLTNYQTNLQVIHQSWARSEEEVETKLKNWSHRKDFNTADYLVFWRSLTSENYRSFKDFHPVYPKDWNKLHFVEANNIEAFIIEYAKKNKQVLIEFPIKILVKKLARKVLKKLRW